MIREYFLDLAVPLRTDPVFSQKPGLDEIDLMMKNYLEEHTDAYTAADQYIQILKQKGAKTRNFPTEYDIGELASDAVTMAQDLPCVQDELIGLLRALNERPETRHLLGLKELLVDIFPNLGDPGPGHLDRPTELRRWRDLNVFIARLYNSTDCDLGWYGHNTLSWGLARKWPVGPGWPGGQRISTDIRNLDGHVSAALAWVDLTGPKLWRENAGVRRRWQEWTQILDDVLSLPAEELSKLDARTVRDAKEAVAKMRVIGLSKGCQNQGSQ